MPRRDPVGKIQHLRDGVKDVEDPLHNNLWGYASDDSWWVHTDSAITTPPESSSSRFRTTLRTAEGDVPNHRSPIWKW